MTSGFFIKVNDANDHIVQCYKMCKHNVTNTGNLAVLTNDTSSHDALPWVTLSISESLFNQFQ